jgi:hypothetical protein
MYSRLDGQRTQNQENYTMQNGKLIEGLKKTASKGVVLVHITPGFAKFFQQYLQQGGGIDKFDYLLVNIQEVSGTKQNAELELAPGVEGDGWYS